MTDFMPAAEADTEDVDGRSHRLIRRVTAMRGSITFAVECHPAFNFARDDHELEIVEGGAVFRSDDLTLGLDTDVPLKADGNGLVGEFTLQEGETAVFVLSEMQPDSPSGLYLSDEEAEVLFRNTVTYWRDWLSKSKYSGRWRETVKRSALALKLMTYAPTGAIVAAPTCGLPEEIGGERNWDYRYTWMRDSSFTFYALDAVGYPEEGEQFLQWVAELADSDPEKLAVLYSIDGSAEAPEE
ncbi:MAG: glycoside hydrolase family 15 protein, partial [Rhodospirillales bacterium]|nr:glycoside hydrolase family 15 protein [Rhodospirillales bacterium]